MAGLGFKDFQVGEVLTSSDVDGYLMQQAVMRFADAGARGSALGTAPGTAVALAEGMVSYLQDTDAVQVYDGSSWTSVVPGIGTNVVQAFKTDTFSTSSTSFTDVTDLSVTITPSTDTSRILLLGNLGWSIDNDEGQARFAVGGSAIAVGNAAGSKIQATWGMPSLDGSADSDITRFAAFPMSMAYLHSPATSSAVTYSIQVRLAIIGATNAVIVNRASTESDNANYARTVSSLIAIEVAA